MKGRSPRTIGRCSHRLLASLCCLLMSGGGFWCGAKKVSGDFRLSGVHTEHLMSTFAVTTAGATFEGTLVADNFYETEQSLRFRAFRDTEWPRYNRETLCTEKSKLSKRDSPVSFDKIDGKWQATIHLNLDNIDREAVMSGDTKEQRLEESPRNHYWYFVILDCSLEQYFHDNRIPNVHFDVTMKNYLRRKSNRNRRSVQGTHFSADDIPSIYGHLICLLVSGFLSFLLVVKILASLTANKTHHSVHAAVLWVTFAAMMDTCSSLWELIHYQVYYQNGIGSYTIDALSAYCEAICDAALMVLLLSIAAGWTLPSSVVTVVNVNANPVQKLLNSLAHPVSNIQGTTGMFLGGIFSWHMFLAQWGRIYNDDCESYHDLEHFPGRLLMWTRVFTGLLFLAAVRQTSAGKFSHSLQSFYSKFTVAGFAWFLSLPVITWFCNAFIPYYKRRPLIFVTSAVLQSSSLVLLAWLVTTHATAFHQYSHMSSKPDTLEESLEDSLQGGGGLPSPTSSSRSSISRTWSLGKKAKVRLD